jgi:hypothetical protein
MSNSLFVYAGGDEGVAVTEGEFSEKSGWQNGTRSFTTGSSDAGAAKIRGPVS